MRGDNDNVDGGAGGPFLPATVSVLLPAGFIFAGYGLVYSLLFLTGRADASLARICLLVLALGGPFLLAHAVLRRFTARVDVMSHAVFVHTGFPRREPYEIPYGLVRRLTLSRGPVERLVGSGTLTFELYGGSTVVISDLARPARALESIGARLVGTPDRSGSPASADTDRQAALTAG